MASPPSSATSCAAAPGESGPARGARDPPQGRGFLRTGDRSPSEQTMVEPISANRSARSRAQPRHLWRAARPCRAPARPGGPCQPQTGRPPAARARLAGHPPPPAARRHTPRPDRHTAPDLVEGIRTPNRQIRSLCSASIWSAPDGSGLLTLSASSVQTDPVGSRSDRLDDHRDGQGASDTASDASQAAEPGLRPERPTTEAQRPALEAGSGAARRSARPLQLAAWIGVCGRSDTTDGCWP